MAHDTSLDISTFDHKADNIPKSRHTSWPELQDLLTKHEYRRKKDGPAYSFATFKPGSTRSNENVRQVSAVVMDIDHHDPEPVLAQLKTAYWGIAHSTFSHSGDNHCWRLIIPITRPLTPEEYPRVWAAINAQLGDVADRNTRDLARMYYLPTCHPDRAQDAFALTLAGGPLDVEALLASNPTPKGSKSSKAKTQAPEKFADSNGRINRRAIVDDMFNVFNGELWNVNGQMRGYVNGHWQTLPEEELVKFVLTRYEGTVIDDALSVVKTLMGLCHLEVEQTEASQRLICMANGTLDPVTMKLHPHAPEHRLTFGLEFDWDPDAKAPTFERFLRDLWGDEADFEERVRCLYEFGGQIFLPSNRYGHFVWLLGQGGNGKSVLSRVFERLAGKGNVSHAALERLSRAATRAQIAEKLLNISSEIGAEATLADGHFKAMVTGDAVDAEPKYKAPYTVYPRVKFMASTNHLPRLRDPSEGFKRRGVILTFPRAFSPEEQDPYLDEKLQAELPGIMVLCIAGLQRLMARGHVLPPPSSVQAMQEYRLESDPIRLFAQECLEPTQERGLPTGTLFERFREWAHAGNYGVTNASRFGRALTNLGYPVTGKFGGKPYRGVRWTPASASDAAPCPTPDGVAPQAQSAGRARASEPQRKTPRNVPLNEADFG